MKFCQNRKIPVWGTLKNGMLTLVLVEPVLWTFYTKHGKGLSKNSFRSSWPAKHCLSGCATVHLAVATESLRKAHDILLPRTSKAVLVHANRVHSLQVPSMYHKILRKLKSVDLGICFHLLRSSPQKTNLKQTP